MSNQAIVHVEPADSCIDLVSIEQTQTKDQSNKNQEQGLEHQNEPKKKDLAHIALLIFLYFLQGLPFGLIGSLTRLILNNNYRRNNTTYYYSLTFDSLALLVFVKILWAPLVDSLQVKRLGRRKTWTLFNLFTIGLCFVAIANLANFVLEPAGNFSRTGITYSMCIISAFFLLKSGVLFIQNEW